MLKKHLFSLLMALFASLIITLICFGLFFKNYPLILENHYVIVFLITFLTIWITIIISTRNQVAISSKQKVQEIDILTERENYRREFIGNVSHELKTPLFSIQGFLLTLIEGGVEDKTICYKYLNRINKSVDRLNYIVKDLDMISELESGKIKIDLKPFDIVSLTQEVFDLLEMKTQKQNVALSFDQTYNPLEVVGDAERIQQVMINLIINAIKHSNKDKTNVIVSFTKEKKLVMVKVEDNGQGIEQEEIPRIFERFYRVEKSRSRKKGGSGLGLSIVKHILEAHGEKVQVKSRVGKGTAFLFHLKAG